MKKRRIIIASVVLLFLGIGIIIYLNRNIIILKFYGIQYTLKERKYINILEDNKEDFEYVGNIMKQWPRSVIFFNNYSKGYLTNICFDDCLASNNEEIISELSNNKEFYEHVMKIYKTNGFYYIYVGEHDIAFGLLNPPRNCHGELKYYYKEHTVCSNMPVVIDENWELWIKPNI